MGYNRENYRKVKQMFLKKHLIAEEAALERAREVSAKYPEIRKIEDYLSETGIRIMQEISQGKEGIEGRLAILRKENQALCEEKKRLLVKYGYSPDYTDVKYECTECSDSGYVGFNMCRCMKRELSKAAIESSGLAHLIKHQSFESFSFDYYKTNAEAFNNIKTVFEICRGYALEFDTKKASNLLLIGKTGLGKTHLSTSMAKVIIEKGFDVVYETAQNLVSDFEFERFSRDYGDNSESRTNRYFECDLLILDDLGTEVTNQFTVSCIYNIINTRINTQKSMIINTNLSYEELQKRYADRITSRIFGEFELLYFIGTDIRQQKLMKK